MIMVDTLIRLIADEALIIMIALAGLALLGLVNKRQRLDYYARIVLAGLTGLLVAKFMAAVFQPATVRPFEKLGITPGASYLDNPGFPSDHALLATAIFFAVWFAVRKKWLTALMAVFVLMICVGRVLALVHTPLDVVGGILAASIGALWYLEDQAIKTKLTKLKKRLAYLQKSKT